MRPLSKTEAAAQENARTTGVMLLASSLWIGGAESVIRHLATHLDRRRFTVTVCHLKDRGQVGEELAGAGVEVIGVPPPAAGRVDYLTFVKLRRILKERKVAIVHTHTTHALTDACLCKLTLKRLRVVHTFHFGNYPRLERRYRLLEFLFSRLASRLFAVGEVQRRQIRAAYLLPESRIGTIRNGVELPAGAGDQALRRELDAGERVVVGTIATLIAQKGLFDLLEVARRVRDSGRDVLFVIVGEGHLREQLETRRRALGLESSVAITGWITDAAAHALPSFDVFFQPSLWEAMSVVILEAMAAARPIVATRVGENSLVLEDGVSGLLVDPGDHAAMAAALCRLLDDAGLRRRLGSAARAAAETRFTVGQMTRAYEQVYEEVLR